MLCTAVLISLAFKIFYSPSSLLRRGLFWQWLLSDFPVEGKWPPGMSSRWSGGILWKFCHDRQTADAGDIFGRQYPSHPVVAHAVTTYYQPMTNQKPARPLVSWPPLFPTGGEGKRECLEPIKQGPYDWFTGQFPASRWGLGSHNRPIKRPGANMLYFCSGHTSTLCNSSSWSLFRLSLGCLWDPPSIIYSIDMIRTSPLWSYFWKLPAQWQTATTLRTLR